eukprot:gene9854-7744_t
MVWPFTSSPNGGAGTVSAMAKELEQLRVLTAQLQEQLRAKSKVTSGEYLYHYSTETMKDEWELEYVVLSGTSLHFYKSSKDVMYNPQEEVPIMGCSLEWEGLTSGHYWAFSIVDPGGNPLARLAALSGGLALKWVEALAAEGCVEEASSDTSSEGGGSMSSKDSSMHGMVRRNSFEGSLPPSGGFGISGNQGKGSLQRSSSHVASAATKKKSGALDAVFIGRRHFRTSHHKLPQVPSAAALLRAPPAPAPSARRRLPPPFGGGPSRARPFPLGCLLPHPGGLRQALPLALPVLRLLRKLTSSPPPLPPAGEANPEPSVRSARRTNKLPMSGSSPVHTAVTGATMIPLCTVLAAPTLPNVRQQSRPHSGEANPEPSVRSAGRTNKLPISGSSPVHTAAKSSQLIASPPPLPPAGEANPEPSVRSAGRTNKLPNSGSSPVHTQPSPREANPEPLVLAAPTSVRCQAAVPPTQQPSPREANPEPSVRSTRRTNKLPMSGSSPVHTAVKSSYLSSDRFWNEKHNGLYNLAAVVLVNLLLYGWRYNPLAKLPGLTVSNSNIPLVSCYPALLLFSLLALAAELLGYQLLQREHRMFSYIKLSSMAYFHESCIVGFDAINAMSSLVLPCVVITKTDDPPGGDPLATTARLGPRSYIQDRLTPIWPAARALPTYRTEEPGPRHAVWGGPYPPSAVTHPLADPSRFVLLGGPPVMLNGVGLLPPTAAGKIRAPAGVPNDPAFWQGVEAKFQGWAKLIRQARRGGQVAGMGKAHKAGSLMPGERGSPATPTEWGALQYPENLTVKNLAYFYVAPTLVYQVNYPQTPTIRIKWIMHRVVELIFATTLVTIITKQFLEPVINSALEPMAAMNLPHVVERVLRLALPSTYVWLCFFFIVFHLWLNILAELTRYGDREFYKDWWNASTLGEYWRLWNMPVHKWMLRHVYFPSVRFGMSRFSAGVLSFFVSAVFHELLLGVPLHMLRYWVFAGMMMQVPLVALSEFVKHKIKRDDWGNIIFWVSFCILGQ